MTIKAQMNDPFAQLVRIWRFFIFIYFMNSLLGKATIDVLSRILQTTVAVTSFLS
jgi:hypothetical protein